MANEISKAASISASKGGASISHAAVTKQLDMSGADMLNATQLIGTTTEALALGDIAVGHCHIRIINLDSTNYVEIGLDTPVTQIFVKLLPGDMCLFSPPTNAIYAKANTAACLCQITACEA